MYFDIDALDLKRSYKLLASTVVPRPIAWVVTVDESGRANAAPFSFFNFFSGHPPTVCLGIGEADGVAKDSLHHIRQNGEFVINLVSEELAQAMNLSATPFARGVSEIELLGLETLPSTKVAVPRIARSPVALECELAQTVPLATSGSIVIAHVRAVHIKDEAVINAERCYIDTPKLDLIGRMESPGWYTRTHDRFKMRQLSVAEWEARQQAEQE